MNQSLLPRPLAIPGHALLLVLLLASPALASGGVLLAVSGEVSVTSYRVTSAAKTGLRVRPGAIVSNRGGTATLLLSDGSAHAVREGSPFTLPETEKGGAPDPFIVSLMDTLREMSVRGGSPVESGVTMAAREIVPGYPYNSIVRHEDLHFEWQTVGGAEAYEITLKAPSPIYAYRFTTDRKEGKADLPGDAPPLLPGVRYYWQVKSLAARGEVPLASPLCWFSIPDVDREEGMRKEEERIRGMAGLDEEGREMLMASLFITHGLYHKGMTLLGRRLRKYPGDEGAKDLLRGLFSKMNRPEMPERPQ